MDKIQIPLLIATIATCGILGKITAIVFLLKNFGKYLNSRHKKKIANAINIKMNTFVDKMKKEGHNVNIGKNFVFVYEDDIDD